MGILEVLLGGGWTKTDKNTASVFRVFDLLYIQIKPYESKLSTALSECEAVARCATRKTDTAINRIKTDNALKLWLLLRNMDTANNVELHKRLSDT